MKKKILLILLVVLMAAPAARAKNRDKEAYEALKPLMEVYSIILDNYVDEEKTAPDKLVKGAIDGMVGTLDPFSHYMDELQTKDMGDDTKAQFGGLGIEISVKDGQLIVVAPIEDTPAYRAGIKAGDKIMLIDGESTEGLTVNDAVHKLRGTPGTKVTISIARDNAGAMKDYTITRDIIKITTVRYNTIGDEFGYIRINEFMGDCSSIIEKALAEFKSKKIKKLIIDLRDNPGGLLDQAVECSDLFLPKGSLVVYTEGRTEDKKIKFYSEKGEKFKGKIVILINRGSASASEILTGALQDNKRAVVIGSNSFGKGSVQTILPLSDRSSIRLTTAQYFTPSGRKIHGVGIKPDIELDEPIASSFTADLLDKNIFEDFAAVYLKKHPEGLTGKKGDPEAKEGEKTEEKKSPESVKVSESDLKVLFKKSDDDKIIEEFRNFLKEQKVDIKNQEFAGDKELILNWIKVEIAKKEKGRQAARKVSVENDIQIKRAMDILNTISKELD